MRYMKSVNTFSRKGTRSHVPCNSPSEPPSETELVCRVQPPREAPARRIASRPPAPTRGRWPLESYGRFPFRPTTPSRPPRCLPPKNRARRRRGGRRPPTPRDFGLRRGFAAPVGVAAASREDPRGCGSTRDSWRTRWRFHSARNEGPGRRGSGRETEGKSSKSKTTAQPRANFWP